MTDEFLGLRKVAEWAVIRGVRMPLDARRVLALLDRVETAERERDAYRDGTTITKLAVAEQALQRVRELHRNSGASQGYTDEGYGNIEDCCGVCGTFGEYGEPWPCPTIMAVEGDA